MEGGRFVSSRDPRTLGFLPERGGSSSNKEIPNEMISKPATGPTPIVDRFRALLKEREEDFRASDDEDDIIQPSAEEVVQLYEVVLSELTFNSKPIITELTMIAGDHKEYSEGIADAICARIIEAPVDQKLPSLYLLDSIVKNIGFEYIRHFTLRLPEVFCEAYRQVPPNQHRAMRHLFGTWSAVFPRSVLGKIGAELEFSTHANPQSSASASSLSSESPSPRPTHGIHVNPKYLEARRQFEQANVVNDVQDARGISSNLQRYTQKPPFGHDEYDTDHTEVILNQGGNRRLESPGIASRASIGGAERLISSKAKPLRPPSPSKLGLTRSLSPSDGFQTDSSPRRAVERASPSHGGFEYGPGRGNKRVGERNDWWIKHASDNNHQHIETSNVYHPSNGSEQKRPRALIDAYGSYKGESMLNEKPLRVERLDVNGINCEASARKWQNSEEEEYVWEDMSPTFADRSRSNDLMSSRLLGAKTGSGRPPNVRSEPNFRTGNWPRQPQLPVVDDSSILAEDGILNLAPGHGVMSERSALGLGNRFEATQIHGSNYSQEPWNLQHQFRSSQHNVNATPFSSSGTLRPSGQRMPSLMDNIDSPSSVAPRILVESHLGKRPRSPPMALPPWPLVNVHNSYPPHSFPNLPPQKQIQGQFDFLDDKKSLGNQGPNDVSVFPQQQFDAVERKGFNSSMLPQLPQLGGLTFPNQSQGQSLPLLPQVPRPQVPQENFVSRIPAQVPPYLAAQPFRGYPLPGPGLGMNPFPLNRISEVPSLPNHSAPNTTRELQGGALPPLPPGPPPVSSQMGLSSQNTGPIPSHPPSGNSLSGLINTLMAQGLISLTTPVAVQDSVGVEFNADALKVRHESAIKALYADLPRQCTTCGLRFKCQEEHSAHMDWHVTKNRVSKNRKQKPSRNWFVSTSVWLTSAEAIGTDAVPGFLPTESVMEKKDDEEMAVPADENQTACALCGELFDDFYSDETEEWMYKGAVYLNAPNGSTGGMDRSQLGPIVHAKCRSESTVISPEDFGLDERGKIEEDSQRKRMRG